MRALEPAADSCTKACVVGQHGAPRGWGGLILRVREPWMVRRLAAFFPHAWDGRESGVGGAWFPCMRITFSAADGSPRQVLVSPNFRYYSVLRGDWPLRPGLRRLLDQLAHGT